MNLLWYDKMYTIVVCNQPDNESKLFFSSQDEWASDNCIFFLPEGECLGLQRMSEDFLYIYLWDKSL